MALERDFKKQFQAKLKRTVHPLAILQYKQDSTTVKGFPDTIVVMPESIVVFIEFKRSKTAKFQTLQKEWGEKLTAANFFYYVVYPGNADEVLEEIKQLV